MKNSFVFGLALILAALPLLAKNEPITPPGEGTKDSPYLISKMEHLVWMEKNVEYSYRKYYKLTCDLDASETKSWNNGKGFIPIGMETPSNKRFREKGKSYPPFLGHFDGGGHSISNLYIRRPEEDYAAFFGKVGADWMPAPQTELEVQGGFTRDEARNLMNRDDVYVVKDLALLNVDFTIGLYGAGLAGKMTDCQVSGCYVSGTITANKSVTGLATITLRSYFSECGTDITFENRYCGMAGMSISSMSSYFCDCYCSGKFKLPENFTDPKHIGETKDKQGGGWQFHGYSTFNFSGMQGMGNSFFENCYCNMKQQGSQRSKRSRPLPKKDSVKSCYCSADNFGVSKEPNDGIISNENMRKKETFKDWDFENIWEMKSGRKAPSLRKLEKWM